MLRGGAFIVVVLRNDDSGRFIFPHRAPFAKRDKLIMALQRDYSMTVFARYLMIHTLSSTPV